MEHTTRALCMHRLPNGSGLFSLVVVFLAALLGDDVLKASPPCYMPPLWAKRFRGPGNAPVGEDYAFAIALDSSGNTFVTGFNGKSDTGGDILVVKYDAAGCQSWVARYNGPSDNLDLATAIVLDGLGNVYVTGYSWHYTFTSNDPTAGNLDYVTLKYDGSGNILWAVQ